MPHPKVDYLWRTGQVDVVRGHIYFTVSTPMVCIRKEDVQIRITEDQMMRLPSGKEASQWAFLDDQSIGRTDSRENALSPLRSYGAFLHEHGIGQQLLLPQLVSYPFLYFLLCLRQKLFRHHMTPAR
jgi:hypothetical protein